MKADSEMETSRNATFMENTIAIIGSEAGTDYNPNLMSRQNLHRPSLDNPTLAT